MAMVDRLKNKDVEFAVDAGGKEHIFATFQEAASFALQVAISGKDVDLDVLVYSEDGAKWVGGDDAVKQYREDPDASVFNRYRIRVSDQGSVA